MIEVSNVTKNFGNFRALTNVNFSIPTGQIVGLLGPNGAGKTTTMRMITGFLKPNSGKVLIDGVDIARDSLVAKQKIGYMSESAPLYAEMIVYDYLKFVAQVYGVPGSNSSNFCKPSNTNCERINDLCNKCGLSKVMHKNIGELSRGNKQRVALAAALMNDPEILILDEPTSGLDPNQVEDVRNLIRELGKTRTVILSTHILSEAQLMCSRVIIINDGKIVADSPTESLTSNFSSNNFSYNTSACIKVISTASETALSAALNAVNGIQSLSFSKNDGETQVTITCSTGNDIRPAISRAIVEAGLDLCELTQQKNTLEDIFHLLTEDTGSSPKDKDKVATTLNPKVTDGTNLKENSTTVQLTEK